MIAFEEYIKFIPREISKFIDDDIKKFLEETKAKYYEIGRKYNLPEDRLDKRWRMIIDYAFSRIAKELSALDSRLTEEEKGKLLKASLPEQLSRGIAWARGLNAFIISEVEGKKEDARKFESELFSLEGEVRRKKFEKAI